jgi:penicillin-binding protein 1A
LLAGVWTGCDDRFIRFQSTSEGQGSSVALPIWAYFFHKAQNDPSTGINAQQRFNNTNNLDNGAQSLIYDWAHNIKDSSLNGDQNEMKTNESNIGPESDTDAGGSNDLPLIGGSGTNTKPSHPQPKAVMPSVPAKVIKPVKK